MPDLSVNVNDSVTVSEARDVYEPVGLIAYTGFEVRASQELLGGNVGTSSFSTTTKRSGAASFRTNPTGTATGYGDIGAFASSGLHDEFNIPSAFLAGYFRYATKPTTGDEEFLELEDSDDGTKMTLRLNSAGNVVVYDKNGSSVATGGTALAADTWYRIRLQAPTGDSSNYKLFVNDTAELSGTIDTGSSRNAAVVFGKQVNRNGNSVDFFFDDWTVNDSEYVGDQVALMKANADGTFSSWTGSYTNLDEVPPDGDTTAIDATISGAQKSVNLTSSSTEGISGNVKGVTALNSWRYPQIGSAAVAVFLYSGTTSKSADGVTRSQSTTYTMDGIMATTDPADGNAWTLTDLDNLQVGSTAQGPGLGQRLTALYASVLYDPAVEINVFDSVSVSESVTMFLLSIDKSDTVTISESVTVLITSFVNVNDAVSLTESVAGDVYYPINANDAVTVAESVTARVDLNPSVSDSVAVAEAVTMLITSFISVNDAVTVSESVTVDTPVVMNVSDTVTLSESVSMLTILMPNVSDAITASESVAVSNPTLPANVSESVTVAESVTANIVIAFSVSDTVTLTESVSTLLPFLTVIVNQSIIVSEHSPVVTANGEIPTHEPEISDNVTVTDVSTVAVAYQISGVLETVGIAENFTITPSLHNLEVGAETVVVRDVVTTVLSIGHVNVNDAVTVAESVKVGIADLVSKFESVTITESVSIGISVPLPAISDSVAVSESAAVLVAYQVNVNESVAVSESVTLAMSYLISRFDDVAVSEKVNPLLVSFASVSDAVTVTEARTVAPAALAPSVFESVAVSDVRSVSGPPTPPNVSDGVAVTESVTLAPLALAPSVFDSVAVSDVRTVGSPALPATPSDSVSVTESVSVAALTPAISVSESITVSDVL